MAKRHGDVETSPVAIDGTAALSGQYVEAD